MLGKEVLNRVPIGRIRVQTLVKALIVLNRSINEQRPLTVDEIVEVLYCSRGHAYNYQRFLRCLIRSEAMRNDEHQEED